MVTRRSGKSREGGKEVNREVVKWLEVGFRTGRRGEGRRSMSGMRIGKGRAAVVWRMGGSWRGTSG